MEPTPYRAPPDLSSRRQGRPISLPAILIGLTLGAILAFAWLTYTDHGGNVGRDLATLTKPLQGAPTAKPAKSTPAPGPTRTIGCPQGAADCKVVTLPY